MAHFTHHSEENYLKTLFKLENRQDKKVNNTALAKALNLNPATVLEMIRKLTDRKMVQLKADKSIQLTDKGKKKALLTIRKHRLWEVFLVEKMNYKWNEVHELAEQLEHIESTDLVDRLDSFLGKPSFDPHGDPIPDKNGKIKTNLSIPLSDCLAGKNYTVINLIDTSDSFLDYLEQLSIKPDIKFKLVEHNKYDNSSTLIVNKKTIQLSEKAARNILVKPA
ncbi:MAG TPA: metal-dependent transcriptional regulator [Chitinophagaceae bacterium]|nr:metal-dependent transcriptional regulator [Chitinophagaceae bacterium]